jgi:hypothetical protein
MTEKDGDATSRAGLPRSTIAEWLGCFVSERCPAQAKPDRSVLFRRQRAIDLSIK